MIVKNPYKVLVKNYRVINLLLLIPIIYLLFSFTSISEFFRQFVDADYYTAQTDLTSLYVPAITLITAIVTTILHFIVWLLLTLKKKKNYYHIISAGYSLFLFLALVFFYTSLLNVEMGNVENTFANFLRDISNLVIYPIYVLILMGTVNVLGLNIKTLRFDKHEDLKITEEDEEDIEIKVGSDTNDTKKRFVHIIRELKYYIIENKIILVIIIIGLGGAIGFKAFLNYQVYNQTFNMNKSFSLDNFSLSVKESYITNLDYSGRIITKDKYYLAIKLGIHNQGNSTTISKDVFRIMIDDKIIYPSYDKGSRFVDIGKPYTGDTIMPDEAHDYVFIYELTEKQLKNKFELRILSDLTIDDKGLTASYKKINIRPEYLSTIEKKSPKKRKEKITFTDSTLKKTTYKLKTVKVQSNYKYSYEICYTERNCNIVEDIIVPTGGKTLMIIEDEIDYDSSSSYSEFEEKNFYENFVTLEYTFDIKTGASAGPTTQLSTVRDVTPKQIKDLTILEVPVNLMSSYKIDFKISIRNQLYTIKVLE